MGTNFYWIKDDNKLHIGKSSGGWCFALRVHPDEGITSLEDWIGKWTEEKGCIKNEYGGTVTLLEMVSEIVDREEANSNNKDTEWFKTNWAVPGPRGLVRSSIGNQTVAHGKGTWDVIIGDFA